MRLLRAIRRGFDWDYDTRCLIEQEKPKWLRWWNDYDPNNPDSPNPRLVGTHYVGLETAFDEYMEELDARYGPKRRLTS